MTIAHLTAHEVVAKVASGEVTAVAVVEDTLARIAARDGELGAYLAVDRDGALAAATEVDRRKAAGEPLGVLGGLPIAVKDMIVTRGVATTAGSKILGGWIPPYDAHVVDRLRAAGAVIVGKANCDEFGMGSSTENSAFHPTKNPWDVTCVPGGSSGGSAAAVAAGLAHASLATDTGGSIRQPAALCGAVGIKPTYGRVSRYGVVAYASSLDQVGPIARTVADAALVLEAIAGHDPRDATSLAAPVPPWTALAASGVTGVKIGVPADYFGDGLAGDVKAAVESAIEALRTAGAEIVTVSLPHTKLALPAYYLIAPAEASSNLARYDGVRYGARTASTDLADMYARTRGDGFGAEVKRRIMIGTFALRAGYYDAYYKKAQQVRALIKRDFDEAFTACDCVITPTTPTVAWSLGAKTSPMDLYLADIYTLATNLAGLPGISVPCGLSEGKLPIGAQLIGKPLGEAEILRAATVIESALWAQPRWPEAFAS